MSVSVILFAGALFVINVFAVSVFHFWNESKVGKGNLSRKFAGRHGYWSGFIFQTI